MTGRALPDLSAVLARFVADAAVDDAARSRALEHSLSRQAGDDASLTGVLLDLAERGRPVVVSTGAGRRLRGVLRTIATDFCIMRTDAGVDQLISFGALGMVQPLPHEAPTTGDRSTALDLGLARALAHLGEGRPRVRIFLVDDPEPHIGELTGVGRDVLTLRPDGDPPPTRYISVASIAELAMSH